MKSEMGAQEDTTKEGHWNETMSADIAYPLIEVTKLAFGSCHKNKKASVEKGIVWEAIAAQAPDAFLWTGKKLESYCTCS
jgi:hypothetical protein